MTGSQDTGPPANCLPKGTMAPTPNCGGTRIPCLPARNILHPIPSPLLTTVLGSPPLTKGRNCCVLRPLPPRPRIPRILCSCPLPLLNLCPQLQNGEGFDLIGHGGHELEIISAKHLAQHLSSGSCTELVEIEDSRPGRPHILAYASSLESGSQPPCMLQYGGYLVIHGHPEMKGEIHRRKGARSLCGWKKAFLGSWQ